MGIQTHFDKFHGKIKLSREDAAYKKARDRDDSITKAIKLAFKEAEYPVIADFIQGSHATNTAILSTSGDHDIDRALVIGSETAPSNPVEPKLTVYGVLENRGFRNAKIKTPCVTADYSSENVHIDFPIYKESSGQHHLAVGKKYADENNRSWSDSDPRGLITWVNDKSIYLVSASDKHWQFRRCVRYLKRWRDHQFSDSVANKIYSIGLTVMARERFDPSFNEDGFRQDLKALRDTVNNILNDGYFVSVAPEKYKVQVTLPVQPWRDIFDGSSSNTGTQLRNKMESLKDKLSEALELEDERKQCIILNKLFGDDFVVPEPPKENSKFTKAVYPTAGAVGTSQGA